MAVGFSLFSGATAIFTEICCQLSGSLSLGTAGISLRFLGEYRSIVFPFHKELLLISLSLRVSVLFSLRFLGDCLVLSLSSCYWYFH